MLTSAGKHAHKNIISACLVGITLNLACLYAYICTLNVVMSFVLWAFFFRKDLKDFELWLTRDTSNYVTTGKVQNSPESFGFNLRTPWHNPTAVDPLEFEIFCCVKSSNLTCLGCFITIRVFYLSLKFIL